MDAGTAVRPQNIAVDLDGTLIATDLLWESGLRYLMSSPAAPFRAVGMLSRGKSALKTSIAAEVDLDPELLPYRADVVAWLRSAKDDGARIVLATAAARPYAEGVAEHLGLFEAVIATDLGGPNMRSGAKAAAIDDHFDGEPWLYVGDSHADLAVWRGASAAVTAEAPPRVHSAVDRMDIPATHLESPQTSTARAWAKQLRIHQWIKNILVLLPLVTSHLWTVTAIVDSLVAFLAFGFAASSVYVWNDLRDLDTDRAHRTKRRRPLAAGRLPIPQAVVVAVVLAILSLVLSAIVGWLFLVCILVYVVVTTVYTAYLKRKLIADVVTLAVLYTWRIVAGCAAVMVAPSIWLLAFSIFLFFSLAVMKRYAELVNHESNAKGRGYENADAPVLLSTGISAGLVATLVLVLYLDSPQVTRLYENPIVMWALVPLVLYWLTRTWSLAGRKKMDDDPILFAARDRVSLMVVALAAVVVVIASL
ncbi:UbiA family prenyltransferase [Agromyces allii]|uniref:UbiA family prenyltransferase n=1 Tax=Agromyces allii TaxID=393607 RepID=A0ABP5BGQ5_9MICO